jgi:hypothetical protein
VDRLGPLKESVRRGHDGLCRVDQCFAEHGEGPTAVR